LRNIASVSQGLRQMTLSSGLYAAGSEGLALKRPLNAYLLFMQDNIEKVRRENPKLKLVSELMPIISKQWNALPETSKKPYIENYLSSVEEYRKQVDALPREKVEGLKMEKSEKLFEKKIRKVRLEMKTLMKDRPARPKPFSMFVQDTMNQLTGPQTEKMKAAGAAWKILPDTRKAVYTARFEGNMEVYKKQMLEWEEKFLKDGRKDKLDSLKAEYTKLKRRETELKFGGIII
jgi:hypothetical protein